MRAFRFNEVLCCLSSAGAGLVGGYRCWGRVRMHAYLSIGHGFSDSPIARHNKTLRQVLKVGRKALVVYLVWKVTFEDLEPADLNHRICVIGFVLVAGQKQVLGTLYNDTAEVGCTACVDKVLLKLSEAPRCKLAEAQARYGIGCTADRYHS
jgi:hypothetical protein